MVQLRPLINVFLVVAPSATVRAESCFLPIAQQHEIEPILTAQLHNVPTLNRSILFRFWWSNPIRCKRESCNTT